MYSQKEMSLSDQRTSDQWITRVIYKMGTLVLLTDICFKWSLKQQQKLNKETNKQKNIWSIQEELEHNPERSHMNRSVTHLHHL